MSMTKEDKESYWQVSDDAPAVTIQGFTKDCPRTDCHLSFKFGGGTMMGTSKNYDKNGQLHIDDRNAFHGYITCGTCWKSAKVNQDGEIIELYRNAK